MGNLLSLAPSEGHSSTSYNNNHSNNITINCNTINTYYDHEGLNSGISQLLYTSEYGSHRDRVLAPVEGTCTWITKHPKYQDWFEVGKSGLLWLSADPGCGKSVIASFLVDHLKAQYSSIVCYFFFKDDCREQRSAKFALSAVLHQLFAQRNSLCEYAEEALEDKGRGFTEDVDTLWGILVKAVTEGGFGDVICVLDGLDECEKVSRDQLIYHMAALGGLRTSGIPLKFLVTSRPYLEIEDGLGSPEATTRLRGEDEAMAIASDITRVIDNGIKELEVIWGNPGGLGYLRSLLNSSADRTLLWVSLVLEDLMAGERYSHEEFTRIVSTPPRGLAEVYTNILDRSLDPDGTRRILHMVVAAARPFTLREMNVAFTTQRKHSSTGDLRGDPDPDFGKTVKNLCGAFVQIVDSKIYLVHQTAREFLIESTLPGRGNWLHTLCPEDSNFLLADICISYLALGGFESDALEMDTHRCGTQGGVHDYA